MHEAYQQSPLLLRLSTLRTASTFGRHCCAALRPIWGTSASPWKTVAIILARGLGSDAAETEPGGPAELSYARAA
jgi:hypothetical protein